MRQIVGVRRQEFGARRFTRLRRCGPAIRVRERPRDASEVVDIQIAEVLLSCHDRLVTRKLLEHRCGHAGLGPVGERGVTSPVRGVSVDPDGLEIITDAVVAMF